MIRFLALALTLVTASTAVAAPPPAGAPGDRHTWTAADKHGFGTATQLGSRTWFTLRSAELTEVYYPDLGTPSLRQLEFVVSDGQRFVDRETGPGVSSRVEPIPGSLSFRQVTETRRWRLTKTWIADPARDAVLGKVSFRSLTGRKLRLYVLVDPAPGDDGNDDRGSRLGHGLAAWDDTVASVVAADPKLGRHTSGYAGTASDPWTDLRRDGDLDRSYEATQPGNVVQAARTRLTGTRGRDSMTLAIGFGVGARLRPRQHGANRARVRLRAARHGAYAAGWAGYLGSVNKPPRSVRRSTFLRRVYDQSVMVLEASRTRPTAARRSPRPRCRGSGAPSRSAGTENSGPYHLVWPRDLYHVATAQQALGDEAAATRLLDYLWRVQKPDGSWWQNTEVSGEPHWTGTQMDEVSLPIVLAWWLGRTSAADWQHVRAAADYVMANGPESPQERWENQDGWSPNTIATEIAGLICAADIARKNGDAARAAQYEATADAWQRSVEDWTATDSTEYHSPAPYYLRLTKDANPNDGSDYNLGDNFPRPVDEREIVDQSFLGLVLFGVKPHDDPTVLNSLEVGDDALKVVTPNGPVWNRFTHDGYGETASGGDWDIFPTAQRQTFGRLWPLLTGERGEYELLAGRDATPHLATIARTANDGLMLPEQVWDGRPPTDGPVTSSERARARPRRSRGRTGS